MAKNHLAAWEGLSAPPDHTVYLEAGEWLIFFDTDGMYILESDGTVHGPFNSTIAGSSAGEIFIGAASMWPSSTNGSAASVVTQYVTNDQDLYLMAFGQTADEYAQFNVWMPTNWNAGTITFEAAWTVSSATGGDVIWGLQALSYANSDPIDAAWGTAVTVTDTFLTNSDVHYAVESSAITVGGTPAAGELVQFRVYRNASAGGDTLDAIALLIGIKIHFTKS